jgi:hypothetical protein
MVDSSVRGKAAMVIVVLAGLSAGSAVFAVLDRPFARDPGRHARLCRLLITLSAAVLVIAAGVATGGWLGTGIP